MFKIGIILCQDTLDVLVNEFSLVKRGSNNSDLRGAHTHNESMSESRL